MTMFNIPETQPAVEEAVLILRENGAELTRFHCTPEATLEMALGHLYCRGLIEHPGEVTFSELTKETDDGFVFSVEFGEADSQPVAKAPVLPAIPVLEELRLLMKRFFDSAVRYKTHGGIHCGALWDGKEFVALYEDIGRHNTLDKVVGRALMRGFNPAELIYLTSGRVNSEIAEKAVRCGFPLVLSRSIATTLACKIAREGGVGILGRMSSPSPLLFSPPRR